MKAFYSRLLVGLLCLNLQACATTIYNWSEISNPDYMANYSENEKIEYYRRHAIKEYKPYFIENQGKGFSTYAEPDKVYTLNSYTPFVYQLAPDTANYYQESRFWDNASGGLAIASLGILAYAMWGSQYSADQRILMDQGTISASEYLQSTLFWAIPGMVVDLIILGASVYAGFKKQEQYDKIKADYNEALRKELGLSPEQVSQIQ